MVVGEWKSQSFKTRNHKICLGKESLFVKIDD